MLNKEKHQLIMGRILKDFYADVAISSFLGFKGGTCAYFFYGLPRFSVDLDFDLLSVHEEDKNFVFEKILNILGQYGEIKDKRINRFTIFALLSYGNDEHNIKIEINARKMAENIEDHYELKDYLGIPMPAAKKDYLFAGKLAALTMRKETAMRDVYDLYFFAKNNWDINSRAVKNLTGMEVKELLQKAIAFIEKLKDNQMLAGLGELVDNEKEEAWIKKNLKTECLFLLKNYLSVMR
jgi:predicted nucleotidyltransferase component of viral defense system